MTALTPCIAVCTIDAESQLCVGCLRSRDEIARWPSLTNDARRIIMDGLVERRAFLGGEH